MGAIGQKNTPSEDPSCLVGSAAFTLALASPELAAGRSGDLAEHANEHVPKGPFFRPWTGHTGRMPF
jgi:hypothetical protein